MSGQAVVRIENLPAAPLDAAAAFYGWVPDARAVLAGVDSLVLIFDPAGHEHRSWRLAAVQELAREAAPKRVNGVVGEAQLALAECANWLAEQAGITGQLLVVDGKAGEKV